MAQIEILSPVHGHATALVGSQEFVNWDGIEYDTVINQLFANPNMTADQVAAASSASATAEATYSSMAVDARYDALRNAVDAWSIALKASLPAQKGVAPQGFANAKAFWQAPTDIDLYDLAKQVNAQVTDANVKAKGTAVMSAVDALVLHKRFTGSKYNMVHGITITGISKAVQKNADLTYYHSLDFATDRLGRVRGPVRELTTGNGTARRADYRKRSSARRRPGSTHWSCHARTSSTRPQWKTRTATRTPKAASTRIAAAAIEASRSPPWNSL